MSGPFVRGTHTTNSMFSKLMLRKGYHKKSSSPDMTCESGMKLEAEEVKKKGHNMGDGDCNYVWVPHERTGIYYPKGQEKVMEHVPPAAVKDVGINWFSCNEDI